MKDMIPKGTGNSRFLRSVSNFKAIYPTYDDFVNALVAGNLPVDFNGINEAGIQQVGTPLSKANLLTDETAAALGLASDDSTVNEAFLNLIGQLKAGVKIKVGSYVGAGKYGSSNQNTLALGFKPKLLIITPSIQKASNNNVTWFGVYIAGRSNIYGFNHRTIIAEPVFINTLAATVTETGISWYSDSADNQMNTSGYTFYYAAIG